MDPLQTSMRLANIVFKMVFVFFAGIGDLCLALNLKQPKKIDVFGFEP